MGVDSRPLLDLDHSFVRELAGLYEPWTAAPAPAPELVIFNDGLAAALGLDGAALRSPAGVEVLVGNATIPGSHPVAQAYAGHQFGGFSPRLGDGRALLLGEVLDRGGQRFDLHLKGSGATTFSRGGDGKAALGPMLREYIISEAMAALNVPTTRSLAVLATGEKVQRDTMLPGAVLARVAASHLRVGSFQYAATQADPTLVRRLADYAIARHYPEARHADNVYLALFEAVLDAQASLVARWMLVGFIHGVMNTDNMTISGETIDYGPCAFMDRFDAATVFSSIDHQGRYAYGNQPQMAQWDLARLAETLLPLIHEDDETSVALATEVLHRFPDRFQRAWSSGMAAKLGLDEEAGRPGDEALISDLITLLQDNRVDYTSMLRSLSSVVVGDLGPARRLFADPNAADPWLTRYRERMGAVATPVERVAETMNGVNPVYIPRNHLVEEALAAATDGELAPFETLVEVVSRPYQQRRGLERYAEPGAEGSVPYRTFCGT